MKISGEGIWRECVGVVKGRYGVGWWWWWWLGGGGYDIHIYYSGECKSAVSDGKTSNTLAVSLIVHRLFH